MIHAWSIDDVRTAENAAMAALPDGELMARAATGLAQVVAARLPETDDQTLVVALVGSGDNGGDALYALAELGDDPDLDLVAVLTATTAHEGGLAAARDAGVEIVAGPVDTEAAADILEEADVVIDAVVGIGGRPGFAVDEDGTALVADLVDAIGPQAYVVACDLPSGADPAGRVRSDSVFADETVTFGVPKPVHVLATSDACGLLTVIDIGIEPTAEPAAQRLEHDDVRALWPVPGPDDDKYSRGVLGVVAGGETYTGAAVLATTSAVCAGAGMVRYVGPDAARDQVRAAVPEAVFGPGRVQAWVVGPGLDADDDSPAGRAQVDAAREALASDAPCVVDAGGLDLLDGPREHAGARTLLTPHAGELARLLSRLGDDTSVDDVRRAPVEHAQRAADLLRATVLLKGATTIVAAPTASGLPVRAQADAPAWLATAGSGDVLAGLAGTLLAAGLDPLDAGSLAALVHGLAGHEANPGGPVRALDVAHAVPRVVARLLTRP